MEEIVVTDLIIEAIKGMDTAGLMVRNPFNRTFDFYKNSHDLMEYKPYLRLPYTTIIP